MIQPALLLAILLAGSGCLSEPVPDAPAEDLKYCNCVDAECKCCVDFNITYVDLGGPGCVKMKYLSQEEGIHINISYGDSQLHEGHVKGNNESATCMNILLDLAQMCARIHEISQTTEGLRACASLEPTLLGDPHDAYHLGCFDMAPHRMTLINIGPPVVKPESSVTAEEESGASQDSFFEAVNESAEDSIAWFTNFWGINFTRAGVNSTTQTTT